MSAALFKNEVTYDEESLEAPDHAFSAVRVVNVHDDDAEHRFTLNEDALVKILLHEKYASKKVAVIGVAGAYRKGKSFLLNFFLRYLSAKENEFGNSDDWLKPELSLKGFSWRGGSERDTNGILIWERPFLIKDKDGQEVAVILMDTQGAFDSQSTVKDCATIFALSTMISSVQIFNLSQNIQEDDLQHLQLFTEYGRMALEDSKEKPFQSLWFLIRDWSFPYEAPYGINGGHQLLEKRLEISTKQHRELQQLRSHIRDCFEKIDCFLLPHPGLCVATNPAFDGKLTEIEPQFQQALRDLITQILDSDNLVLKKVNGQTLTCRELLEYFKSYMKIFQGEELPEPKSMLIATAEANNLAAVASARATYHRSMEQICGGDKPYMSSAELTTEHFRSRCEAVRHFRAVRKMGGADFSLDFLEILEKDIEESFENFKKSNEAKNLFKSMRTPAFLVSIIIVDYICQEIFQLFGLDFIASIFTSLLFIVILALTVWVYSRYSGNLRGVGGFVDDSVNYLWQEFVSPNSHNMGSFGSMLQMSDILTNATSLSAANEKKMH